MLIIRESLFFRHLSTTIKNMSFFTFFVTFVINTTEKGLDE